MSTNTNKMSISLPVASDQSGSNYKFMKGSGAGIVACSAAGEASLGILQTNDANAAGKVAEVAIGGEVKVVAGGIIAAWSEIATDANGKAKVAAAGNIVLGRNIEAAAADGDVISMIFNPSYIKA